MDRKHTPALTPRAKELRKNMTEHETKLWRQFLRKYPVRFLRQKVVGGYIADFYCAKAKLVIELDGSQHFEEGAIEYDSERTAILNGYGLDVIRFTNSQIDSHFEAVCKQIHDEVIRRIK